MTSTHPLVGRNFSSSGIAVIVMDLMLLMLALGATRLGWHLRSRGSATRSNKGVLPKPPVIGMDSR
jgi:hypothetical protein